MASAKDNADIDSTKSTEPTPKTDPAQDDEFKEEGDLLNDGGVIKKILKTGEGWMRPEKGDEVGCYL